MVLPTILHPSGQGYLGDGGLRIDDEVVAPAGSGQASSQDFYLEFYETSGTDSGYSRTRKARTNGPLITAKWSYYRIGGSGFGEFSFEGSVPNMDTTAGNEWEVEVLRGGDVASTDLWWRGRVTRYWTQMQRDGRSVTFVLAEGYTTAIAKCTVTAHYENTTVAVALKNILDNNVTPYTRISYEDVNIIGGQTVVDVNFVNTPVLDAIDTLAQIQSGGSGINIEWGVTEGDPKPQFIFIEEESSDREELQVILESNVKEMGAEGTMDEVYNAITVVGGWDHDGSAKVGTTTADGTSITAYGRREKTFLNPSLIGAADLSKVETYWLNLLKDPQPRLSGSLDQPQSRLEHPRDFAATFAGTGKATFRGLDGAAIRAQYWLIEYDLIHGCPHRLTARVRAGLPDRSLGIILREMSSTQDRLINLIQKYDPANLTANANAGIAVAVTTYQTTAVTTTDQPKMRFCQFDKTTTDATVTNLGRIATESGKTYKLSVEIVARRTGGSSGTTDDGAGYTLIGTFRRSSSTTTVTQIGITNRVSQEDQPAWDADLAVTTTFIAITVKGAANNNVSWHGHAWVSEINA